MITSSLYSKQSEESLKTQKLFQNGKQERGNKENPMQGAKGSKSSEYPS
jgi:hypothetical protein